MRISTLCLLQGSSAIGGGGGCTESNVLAASGKLMNAIKFPTEVSTEAYCNKSSGGTDAFASPVAIKHRLGCLLYAQHAAQDEYSRLLQAELKFTLIA
eukprot:6476835-Amphidinium_carterae.3